jgi:hypothetical protein
VARTTPKVSTDVTDAADMSDWPRAISPEDRVKYLIEARHLFKESVDWIREKDGVLHGSTYDEENLLIAPEGENMNAYYQMGDGDSVLVGEYETAWDARKALTDHAVVKMAIRQAWADVAT